MDNIVDVTVHYRWDVAARVMDAMISDAILGEVVGADFFGAVAGTNEGFASL